LGEGREGLFRPCGAWGYFCFAPTACAVGCVLAPLRGWVGGRTGGAPVSTYAALRG
jgi:hypothetical protein